mmetsp:Transcript_809/g.2106  ORF Transcript_809/g.2106 Transcript_809/m.2106 type:complete len:217 (+) Transcript_809:27-677(+)
MVKHNNVVPNAHFHKKWATSSRGPLKVVTWFDQPAQKKARRMKRAAKAAKVAPRPLGRLRPAVMCPTQRYNSKERLGRGFSLEELKVAGIAPATAKTIGIAVDHRRINKSKESLDKNVERLQAYKAKLIVYPRKGTKAKAGDSTAEECKKAADGLTTAKVVMPAAPKAAAPADVEFVELTDELTDEPAYAKMRIARNNLKLVGIRKKMLEAKEADK